MEKVYSVFIFVDSRSNWPDFLKLGMKTPCVGMGVDFRRFFAREVGDWGFLCDSLQLSLGWDRSGQAEEFLRESKWVPLLLGLSKRQGPGGPVTIMLCLLLATEASCILMLLGGNLLFPKPEDTVWEEKKNTKRTWEKRGGRVRAGWIDRCLFRSSWKTQWSEKAPWLVCFSLFFSQGLKWEGGMGKKKGRGGGLASPEQKQHRTLRVGEGKVTWWFWNPLGSPAYWSIPSFRKGLWLRAVLPVGHFEWRKTKVAEAAHPCPRENTI